MLSETLSDETLRLIAPGMAHTKKPPQWAALVLLGFFC